MKTSHGLRILSLGLLLGSALLSQAQNVGINSTGAAGHPSAMLDVSASNKGVLFPNVILTGANDGSTITSPAKGLMVWNTGASWGTSGMYYNDGTTGTPNWVKMTSGSFSAGTGIGLSAGVISNTGVLSLAGTANQVNVSAATGSITLSTPQNIHTAASPTFAGTTLTGLSSAGIVTNTAGGVLGTTTIASLMADLTPGAGLSGSTVYDGSSAQTFTVGSGNGLTTDAGQDRVKLGGSLDENTTISKGNFGLTFNQTGTGDFDVQDNGSSSFFVYGNDGAVTDGNVGIGTNTPTSKLQVNGSVFIPDGQSYWIGNNTDAGERFRMHHSGTSSYVDYSSGDLFFRANTSNKFILQSDGDVQAINLSGTGNRIVYADANGVLNVSGTNRLVSANNATATSAAGTQKTVIAAGSNMDVAVGDVILVEANMGLRLTGGSNTDPFSIKPIKGGTATLSCTDGTGTPMYLNYVPDEDANDHDNVKVVHYLDYCTCTAAGTVNMRLDVQNTGDDGWEHKQAVLIVTKL